MKLAIASLCVGSTTAFSSFMGQNVAQAPATSSSALSMKYKVAVVGGGPSGACAAEIFAQEKNIDTVLFERKMDNAKPCGGAIPLCMIGEFDIPETTVDRKVSISSSVCRVEMVHRGGGGRCDGKRQPEADDAGLLRYILSSSESGSWAILFFNMRNSGTAASATGADIGRAASATCDRRNSVLEASA